MGPRCKLAGARGASASPPRKKRFRFGESHGVNKWIKLDFFFFSNRLKLGVIQIGRAFIPTWESLSSDGFLHLPEVAAALKASLLLLPLPLQVTQRHEGHFASLKARSTLRGFSTMEIFRSVEEYGG